MYGAVWEGFGEEVHYRELTVAQSPAARDFAVAFYRWLSVVLGLAIHPVPVRLMPGGLESWLGMGLRCLGLGGMEDRHVRRTEELMRLVSAEKLVYRIG